MSEAKLLELAIRVQHEADMAARPGQYGRLHAISRELADLADAHTPASDALSAPETASGTEAVPAEGDGTERRSEGRTGNAEGWEAQA